VTRSFRKKSKSRRNEPVFLGRSCAEILKNRLGLSGLSTVTPSRNPNLLTRVVNKKALKHSRMRLGKASCNWRSFL
jgi:hypothetical protein